jgi:hypothetical protein
MKEMRGKGMKRHEEAIPFILKRTRHVAGPIKRPMMNNDQ